MSAAKKEAQFRHSKWQTVDRPPKYHFNFPKYRGFTSCFLMPQKKSYYLGQIYLHEIHSVWLTNEPLFSEQINYSENSNPFVNKHWLHDAPYSNIFSSCECVKSHTNQSIHFINRAVGTGGAGVYVWHSNTSILNRIIWPLSFQFSWKIKRADIGLN